MGFSNLLDNSGQSHKLLYVLQKSLNFTVDILDEGIVADIADQEFGRLMFLQRDWQLDEQFGTRPSDELASLVILFIVLSCYFQKQQCEHHVFIPCLFCALS